MSEYGEYQEYQDRKARGGGRRKHAAAPGGRHAGGGDGYGCMVVAPVPGIALAALVVLGRTLVRRTRGGRGR
ncbi:hypothetical protein [Streptomyces termitum]|uniref:hypothetical protein n=1 Tax=Streptomyces termitum TaxID=67368 RepID=UPI0033B7971E